MNDRTPPGLAETPAALPARTAALPLLPLGATTCFALAFAGFAADQLLAMLAWNQGHPVWGFAIGGVCGVILPMAVLWRWRGARAGDFLGTRLRCGDLGLVVWIVGAALPPLYALSALLSRTFPPPETQLEIYRALIPDRAAAVVGGGVAVVVIAPLAEEILFRGWLLRGFAGVVSLPIAVGCSALLFGASHGSLWLFPPLSLLGLLLGLVVWRTGGLAGAWLGHALFNLVAYADLCITHDVRGARLEALAVRPWVWIPALVLLGWGLVRLRRGLPAATPVDVAYLRD